MKCTLIVWENTIMVCVAGTWPKTWNFTSKDEAREVAFEIAEQKANTNVLVWR